MPLIVAVVAVAIAILYFQANSFKPTPVGGSSIFDFTVTNAKGDPVPLSTLKGKKAYLIVNVACNCGLTNKNYGEMGTLYDKLRFVTPNLSLLQILNSMYR